MAKNISDYGFYGFCFEHTFTSNTITFRFIPILIIMTFLNQCNFCFIIKNFRFAKWAWNLFWNNSVIKVGILIVRCTTVWWQLAKISVWNSSCVIARPLMTTRSDRIPNYKPTVFFYKTITEHSDRRNIGLLFFIFFYHKILRGNLWKNTERPRRLPVFTVAM